MDTGRRWKGRRFTNEERLHMYRLVLEGRPFTAIAAEVDSSLKAIYRVFGTQRARPVVRQRSRLRLSLEEREGISRGLTQGDSLRTIARRLSRAPSTVSREVRANGGPTHYRAWRGDERALKAMARPRPAKLVRHAALRRTVERLLTELWSPAQISAHLRTTYPEDQGMRVSHETIYQALFVQGRGSLRKELTACLRSGRAQRRPRDRSRRHAQLSAMVMIGERPAEADDRRVPGHWEGDLLLGLGGKSAIGTLVERASRFVMLLHLPHGRSAAHVRDALSTRIQELPVALRRSLTWDQGKEMAQHVQFTVDTGVHVYFCDPHSPWQRGTNENTNGLLRQYFPKGMDLSDVDKATLDHVANSLNTRPRQTLGWKTPAQAYAEAVAMTG